MRFALLLAALCPTFAFAQPVEITSAYALENNPASKNGAVFMQINNHGEEARVLLGAKSDVAKITQIHTHIMDGDVMKMVEVQGGLSIPAGGCVILQRGGLHVMLMGLDDALKSGETIVLELDFEHGDLLDIDVPVMSAEEAKMMLDDAHKHHKDDHDEHASEDHEDDHSDHDNHDHSGHDHSDHDDQDCIGAMMHH